MPVRRMTTAELRDALLAAGYSYDPKTRRATPVGGGTAVGRRRVQAIIGRPLPVPLSEHERDLLAAFHRAELRRGNRVTLQEARGSAAWERALKDLRELARKRDGSGGRGGKNLTPEEAKRFRSALQAVYGHRTRAWQFYINATARYERASAA